MSKPERFLDKLKQYLHVHAINAGLFDHWSDERFIKYEYKRSLGRKLDLENPQTFTEKLQWLKLHDRNPEYTRMVDKYELKQYAAEKIGAEYVLPVLGVWEHAEDIDFEALPEQFVLKCTHDSGSIVICEDKTQLDIERARSKLSKRLKRNYYLACREWPYKNVKPRIIAEPFMPDFRELDIKVMCFNGKPGVIEVIRNRFIDPSLDFFDIDFRRLDLGMTDMTTSDLPFEKPFFAEKMLELSEVLAEGIPHVKVDWNYADGRLYLGELTFFDTGGFCLMESEEQDRILGSYLELNR